MSDVLWCHICCEERYYSIIRICHKCLRSTKEYQQKLSTTEAKVEELSKCNLEQYEIIKELQQNLNLPRHKERELSFIRFFLKELDKKWSDSRAKSCFLHGLQIAAYRFTGDHAYRTYGMSKLRSALEEREKDLIGVPPIGRINEINEG